MLKKGNILLFCRSAKKNVPFAAFCGAPRRLKEIHMSKKEAAVRRLLFLLCCGGLVAALTTGCEQGGPKMVQVEGKVTYKGQPVPRGYVSFFAKKGNPSMEVPIGPIEDGEYQ